MRPYANKLTELLQSLSASLEGDSGSQFAEQREVKNVLIVSITSNRGLAGAFNSNIIKETALLSSETYSNQKVDLVTLGKKGNDVLGKSNTIVFNNNEIFDDLTYDNTAAIAEQLMDLFANGSYDKIVLVYNNFKNAATQFVLTEQFLPIASEKTNENVQIADYIFEPSKAKIVEELIPKSLKTQLFKAIRDSVASEHGARMTAMHKATDNATELRDALKLQYNKARQAAITNEILEIVGGAEALAG
jgi:F-type H+-transporting ATPase subunit gamma